MRNDTIKRNTTAELVIEKVLNMITDGELKVGDRLPSAQKLAEIFGVGRSSIREAVRALSVLGYLEILPGKGTFVSKDESFEKLSVNNRLMNVLESGPIFDIMETRECLECKCAELASVRADPAQQKKMEHLIKIMQDNRSDLETINKADLEFHLTLAEATNNDVIYEIMKLLIEKVEFYADKFWATLPKAREKAISTVNQVFYHVVEGDSKKAAQSMREHLELVKDKLKDVISEGVVQTNQKS